MKKLRNNNCGVVCATALKGLKNCEAHKNMDTNQAEPTHPGSKWGSAAKNRERNKHNFLNTTYRKGYRSVENLNVATLHATSQSAPKSLTNLMDLTTLPLDLIEMSDLQPESKESPTGLSPNQIFAQNHAHKAQSIKLNTKNKGNKGRRLSAILKRRDTGPGSPLSSRQGKALHRTLEEGLLNFDSPPMVETVIAKGFRVKLPDNSYRTLPINPQVTIKIMREKLEKKLKDQYVNEQIEWGSCGIYQILPDLSEVELLSDQVVEFIPLREVSEFVFKIPPQAKIIEEKVQNEKVKKQKDIESALSAWLGETKPTKLIFPNLHDKKYFYYQNNLNLINLASVSNPNYQGSNDVLGVMYLIDKLEILSEDFSGIKKRINLLKSVPASGPRSNLAVDCSKVRILQKIIGPMKGNGISIYSVHVDGWKAIMKEFTLASAFSASRFLMEIFLLELLPFHENIIKYFVLSIFTLFLPPFSPLLPSILSSSLIVSTTSSPFFPTRFLPFHSSL